MKKNCGSRMQVMNVKTTFTEHCMNLGNLEFLKVAKFQFNKNGKRNKHRI